MRCERVHFCLEPPELGERGWVYLGKSVDRRLALESRLGRPPLPWGSAIHDEARRLREPFLDWVAEQGRPHGSSASWWAGTFSWKPWAASDLFLLVCYLSAASRLAYGSAALVVVVEDPWLLRQARRLLSGKKDVSFGPLPWLWRFQVKAALLGLARRTAWTARLGRSWLLQRLRSRARQPLPRGAVLYYTYLLSRSVAKGDWDEYYMPGLDADLAEAGLPILRCTEPDATGFEGALAERAGRVEPMILHASFLDILRSAASLPVRTGRDARLEGMPIELLAEREWWHDLSRAGRCSFLLVKRAANRLLAAGSWKALIMPWEGQPQERMWALAAREGGVRSIGYQHTTVSPWQFPFFLGKGEAERAPLPDVIVTSGPRQARALREGGVPEARLRLGGSRRFAGTLKAERLPEDAHRPDVLVILPIYLDLARHFLVALGRAYPRGGNGFDFVIKPHPAEPRAVKDMPLPARIFPGTLAEAARTCGTVVFTGTAAGLEAVALGRPALRYRPDVLMDVDPCDVLGDDVLPTAGDSDLKEKLEALRRSPRSVPAETVRAAFDSLFAPVEKKAWLDAIRG